MAWQRRDSVHAAYLPKPEFWQQTKDIPNSQAPRTDDPLTTNQLSYLNGGGGSCKPFEASRGTFVSSLTRSNAKKCERLFRAAWTGTDDLSLASRKAVRDRAQELLFTRQKEHFPDMPVPLLYHPKDSRKQNIMVTIPGTRQRELALNDVIQVTIEAAEKAVKRDDWRLGYALTVHSLSNLHKRCG